MTKNAAPAARFFLPNTRPPGCFNVLARSSEALASRAPRPRPRTRARRGPHAGDRSSTLPVLVARGPGTPSRVAVRRHARGCASRGGGRRRGRPRLSARDDARVRVGRRLPLVGAPASSRRDARGVPREALEAPRRRPARLRRVRRPGLRRGHPRARVPPRVPHRLPLRPPRVVRLSRSRRPRAREARRGGHLPARLGRDRPRVRRRGRQRAPARRAADARPRELRGPAAPRRALPGRPPRGRVGFRDARARRGGRRARGGVRRHASEAREGRGTTRDGGPGREVPRDARPGRRAVAGSRERRRVPRPGARREARRAKPKALRGGTLRGGPRVRRRRRGGRPEAKAREEIR